MSASIERILNMFPEVEWDRWSGAPAAAAVFGWIARPDGQRDFVWLLIVCGEVKHLATSSAQFSQEFANRIGFVHRDCRRVEDSFAGVKRATHLAPILKGT